MMNYNLIFNFPVAKLIISDVLCMTIRPLYKLLPSTSYTDKIAYLMPPPPMFALCIINVLPAISGSDGVLKASSLFLDHSRPSSRKMAE